MGGNVEFWDGAPLPGWSVLGSLTASLAASLAASLGCAACSFSLLDPMECQDDLECAEVFGAGATCQSTGTCKLPVEGGVATLSGTVQRVVDPAPDGDSIGTLFVVAFATCNIQGAAILGVQASPVDLSENTTVPFSLLDLPRDVVQVTSFLDDNDNALAGARPGPDAGDLTYGFDNGPGVIDCLEFDLRAGSIATAVIPLNYLFTELDSP